MPALSRGQTRRMKAQLFVAAAAMGAASSGLAEFYNVDIGDPFSTFGVPSDAYGAAAGQAGFWNAVNAGAAGFALFDLSGAATSVTLTNIGGLGNFAFDNAGTSGDDQALMDDLQDVGGTGGLATWNFSGLTDGPYWVYTYAWAPDNDTFASEVTVAGSPDPPQLVGGLWPGGHALGTTYALHTIDVVAGTISIDIATSSGFGSVNGFQIVLIPAPGGLVVLAVAGCVGARRRRRRTSQA